MAIQAKIIPTMSTNKMGFLAAAAKAENKEVALGRVWGIARKTRPGIDAKGQEFITILGEFMGLNYKTGEYFSAGKLYLPGGFHEMIVTNVEGEGEVDEKGRALFNAVEFALEISAVPATNPIGYSYAAKPLVEVKKESDAMERLMAQMTPLPQLVAPAKEETAAKAKK